MWAIYRTYTSLDQDVHISSFKWREYSGKKAKQHLDKKGMNVWW